MQTINAKYASTKQKGAQEVSLYIEGLPEGGDSYVLPEATTGALGGVKQVPFVADPAGDTPTKAELVAIRDALVSSGLMAAS